MEIVTTRNGFGDGNHYQSKYCYEMDIAIQVEIFMRGKSLPEERELGDINRYHYHWRYAI